MKTKAKKKRFSNYCRPVGYLERTSADHALLTAWHRLVSTSFFRLRPRVCYASECQLASTSWDTTCSSRPLCLCTHSSLCLECPSTLSHHLLTPIHLLKPSSKAIYSRKPLYAHKSFDHSFSYMQ